MLNKQNVYDIVKQIKKDIYESPVIDLVINYILNNDKYSQYHNNLNIYNFNSDILSNEQCTLIKSIKDDILFIKIEDHGYSGGNCWGNIAQYYKREIDASEYEFSILYDLLEKINNKFSFFEVRYIEKNLVKTYEYTDVEYYGNSTTYIYKYIVISDLITYLLDNKIINEN